MIEQKVVTNWIQTLQNNIESDQWTESQIQEISEPVIELSKIVVPCIVEDVAAIHTDIVQEYYIHKIEKELNNWLSQLAATYNTFNKKDSQGYAASNKAYKVGLRSASYQKIEDLPILGAKLAKDVAAYTTNHPFMTDIAELENIKGLGAAGVATLAKSAYLDNPMLGLLSPALAAFITSPNIVSFLAVLENTNLSFFLGNRNSLLHQHPEKKKKISVYNKLRSFLEVVLEQSQRKYSRLEGTRMSAIAQWHNRKIVATKILNNLKAADTIVLENEAYFYVVKDHIENATKKIYIMMFLGTASENENEVSPLKLIEALEAAKQRGIDVKVILDRDDKGQYFNSRFINKKLYNRLKSNGIPVKFDEKETLLHSKVIIFDDEKAVVGSHNWTENSFNNINELSIAFSESTTAKAYTNQFIELWNRLD